MALVTYQPFKAIYILAAGSYLLARFPLYLLKYLVSYGRQHPEWTFKQALMVRIFSSVVTIWSNINVHTPTPLTPGKEKERWSVVKVAEKSYFEGPMRGNEDVKPVDVGGTWYPEALTEGNVRGAVTVVLHIHGGAFVIGDGRTAFSGYFARKLLKNTSATHVFAPQYRLSTLPVSKTSNAFPAALQDSLTCYLHLTQTLKISPKDIILSGDSAGANLAIALLRYISEYGSDLGIENPSAAWLWSPWVAPHRVLDSGKVSSSPHYNTDYLPEVFTRWGALAYAGSGGASTLNSPYILHLGNYFKTPVPLWVTAGDAEILYFEDKEWSVGMKSAGNDVVWDVEKAVPHDVLLIGGDMGFDKQANACAKRAGEWARGVRGG